MGEGSGSLGDRLQAFEAEVQAAERLLGVAYAENADLRKEVESYRQHSTAGISWSEPRA